MFQTDRSVTLLLIRAALGFDMFVHGAMKLGVIGKGGIPATMRYFDGLNVPHFFAWLAIIAEFFGGIGLMAGLLTRIAAFGVGCTMVVAIFLRHLPYGYLMNWHGGLPFGTEGYEYHTLAIAMAAGIVLEGAGAFSCDRLLAGNVPKKKRVMDLEPAHQ
jgi:putative oxidoreductase